jgi:hypothetical protein
MGRVQAFPLVYRKRAAAIDGSISTFDCVFPAWPFKYLETSWTSRVMSSLSLTPSVVLT